MNIKEQIQLEIEIGNLEKVKKLISLSNDNLEHYLKTAITHQQKEIFDFFLKNEELSVYFHKCCDEYNFLTAGQPYDTFISKALIVENMSMVSELIDKCFTSKYDLQFLVNIIQPENKDHFILFNNKLILKYMEMLNIKKYKLIKKTLLQKNINEF
jgi:hypothetical protein